MILETLKEISQLADDLGIYDQWKERYEVYRESMGIVESADTALQEVLGE